MFIRQKVSRGRASFYLVESRREGGKVRQRVLAYLGPCDTLEGAITHWETEAARMAQRSKRYQDDAAEVLNRIPPAWIKNGEVPNRPHRGIRFRDDLCAQYWAWRHAGENCERWARKAGQRVELLRQIAQVREQ